MKFEANPLSRAACAAALLLSCPLLLRAQLPPNRREERRADMEARQRALRGLSGLNAREANRKTPAAARPTYKQVAEDFEQLQWSNYRLSAAAEPGARLDFEQIREEAAEVRRRASRLKSALALPAVRKEQRQRDAERPLTPEAMRAAIATLDATVKSFAWNPIFQRPDVLDAESAAKASVELDEILAVSERVREAAEALARKKND